MGITSENVAERYGVTRQEQDQAAVSSLEHRLCFISIALTQIKNVFKTLPF
jgi:acetyl-CoA acyltransferase 1